jgi:hypothetical protein
MSGSEKIVTTPRTASTTRPAATTAEVRSRRACAGGLPLGDAGIGGSIDDMRALGLAAAFGAALGMTATAAPAARAAGPKYYFQLRDVKAGPEVNPALKAYAGEALKAELASRPEWQSDLGVKPEAGTEAVVAELKKRNLRGFVVTVRFDGFKKQLKEPSQGGRLKRLELGVKLSVFGTTIPEEKLSFSGDGEAGVESEVSDKTEEAEANALAKDAVKEAVKQAVDQAVMKLAVGKSEPANESRRRKKKK